MHLLIDFVTENSIKLHIENQSYIFKAYISYLFLREIWGELFGVSELVNSSTIELVEDIVEAGLKLFSVLIWLFEVAVVPLDVGSFVSILEMAIFFEIGSLET